MLRIVMDGAGDIPEAWISEYQIHVIPINIQFEEKTFLQGIDLSNEDFYRLVDTRNIVPKTSQPSPQQFIDFYRKIAEPNDTILSIHVTQHLSGTYASAEMAAKELEGEFRVIPVDSANGSVGMGFMCRDARRMERAGAPLNKIMAYMEYLRQNINIILTLDTLEYARLSGRVRTLQAALVSLLDVKPIVMLKDGILAMAGRVRTRKRSFQQITDEMASRMGNRPVNAAVVNARDPGAGEILMELVRSKLNCLELVSAELSIAVAANLGPGTVGIIAYPVDEGGS